MQVHEVFRRLEQLNAGMALVCSPLAILIILSTNYANGDPSTSETAITTKVTNPILDHKRRNDLVDEAFLEQKDILLSMLENKLKEVRDKKRKKADRPENPVREITVEANKCEFLPNNVNLKLKSNGIVGIGDTDLQLRFGDSGNNTLDLNGTGISNVGKIQMKLGIGDGTLQIPGLKDLFYGVSPFLKGPCENQNKLESDKPNNNIETSRRSLELSGSFNESLSSKADETNKVNGEKMYETSQNAQENVTESVINNTENGDETADI